MSNILIVGVGGQGSLLASRIFGSLYLSQGQDVKVSEVHGMSQRGGSVVTYVRAGESVASPIIAPGTADILIALEQLEALRWLHYLKPGGAVVTSTQKILPMPVISGKAAYPENIKDTLEGRVKTVAVDALQLAQEAGSLRCANVVLLGAASKLLPLPESVWREALAESIKPSLLEMNLRAFALGRKGQ